MKCNQLFSRIRVLCAAAFIFGTIPALAALAYEPAAMATTLYAEEPPQPPELSDEEREALDAKRSGTLKPAQKDAATRAERKLDTAEKYKTNATSKSSEDCHAGDESRARLPQCSEITTPTRFMSSTQKLPGKHRVPVVIAAGPALPRPPTQARRTPWNPGRVVPR
jgi:hypothetical protein